ncbi:MAG: MBL fold metallo-hydrolase [Candidatus Nitrohelix vancouverensis]|uniref:MBL fold metallo-hydrolase n=1 Tax=Candidatus Nitrohelix vancouverensis TaxID=2705534 RepID=A0A7T0C194_9BACT|nr:MAG: MBL fold metallo-hydrolase [Candidatus Nitrohelix vancouverensis]
MKITILGSGTAVPSLHRNSSGLLVQDGDVNTLFDMGYGTLKALLNQGIDYHRIDRIFFTHNHPDHICDLIPFLFGSRYYPDPRRADLEIVAAPGFHEFLDQLLNSFGKWLRPTEYAITFSEQDEEERVYENLKVLSKKVEHIPLSRGYRVTDARGASVAISGDTDYCEAMVELGKDADLMILECAFPDDMKVKGHLSPQWAGRLAREANCRKLCLTHFYPPCDLDEIRKACAQEYSGEIFLAEDGMQFEL